MLPLLLLLALHDPIAMMLRIIFFAFLRFHRLFHLKLVRHVYSLVHSWSLLDGFEPDLHLREWLGGDASPLRPVHPGEAAEICDGVFVASQVGGRTSRDAVLLPLSGEAIIQDLIKTLGLRLVAVDGVVDLRWCIWVSH